MGLKIPPAELVPYGLRAMKTVAMADGRFEEMERRMMAAAQQALGTALDVDALEPITPGELAAAITDPGLRNQIAHGLVTTIDPLEGWDPWEVIDTPVDELRERYRIGPPPPWA